MPFRDAKKQLFSLVTSVTTLFLFVSPLNTLAAYREAAPALSKCWEYKVDTSDHGAPAADDTRVFVGTEGGSIQAVEASNSHIIWKTELGGNVSSDLLESDGRIFVVSNSSGPSEGLVSTLRSLSSSTGVTLWSKPIDASEHFYLGKVGDTLVSAAIDGKITSLSASQGEFRWSVGTDQSLSATPSFGNDAVLLATVKNKVLSLRGTDGGVLGEYPTEFMARAVALAGGDTIYIGDERGNVFRLNQGSGKISWNFKSGAAASRISLTEQGLLVSSLDNFVYMISVKSGHVVWKRRMPGRVIDGGLVLEKYIFTQIYGESTGFLLEPTSGKLVGSLEKGAETSGNQAPLRVGDWNLLFPTASGIALYSLRKCGAQ